MFRVETSHRVAAAVIGLVLALRLASAAPAAGAGEKDTCTLQSGPAQTVVRIIDAETVLLDDNREVRLIGALAPRSPDLSGTGQPWPPEVRALAALRDLVLGQTVELAFPVRRVDRYGRLLAHLFVERNGERVWVQGKLLSSGNARAYGLPGNSVCLAELLAHEQVAREARAGLWRISLYGPRSATPPRALLRLRNTYQIVAGRVAHVATTKGRTYVNFGEDWRSDFTAGIGPGTLRSHPEWAKTLAALEGRNVEVRGWIEYRNGPYIEITDPGQIVPVDEKPAPPASAAPKGPSMSSDRSPAPVAPSEPVAPNEKRPVQQSPGALDL